MMVSIMCLCGLPMIVGVFLVEYRSGADIAPEPIDQPRMRQRYRKGARRGRTGVECASSGVSRVRVGEDEVTSGVGGDIRVGLGVFLVVCEPGGLVGSWGSVRREGDVLTYASNPQRTAPMVGSRVMLE